MSRRLVLVGCGGMGRRHLRAYRTLLAYEPGRFELAAVVDPEIERAEFVAGEAEDLLGVRPTSFATLEMALENTGELQVADVVTVASAHLPIVRTATEAGLHVLCEKPMAPTVLACRKMRAAAVQHGRLLSIAENYRRDPVARLMRALIGASVIGDVRSLLDYSLSGGRSAIAGGWQYKRSQGGPLLEMGVHNADLQMYMGGSIEHVYGQVRLREPQRDFRGAHVKPFHEHYSETYPDSQEADAPDVLMATLEYASGAVGQWVCDMAAQGPGLQRFSVVGSSGQIDLPGVRSGRPLGVFLGTSQEPCTDDEVLALVPDFRLDDRTAKFFGGERLATYGDAGEGVGGSADLKLIAMELAELLDAIDGEGVLEVDAATGLTAVALVMAVHESSESRQVVQLSDVRDGSLSVFQDAANRDLGLEG